LKIRANTIANYVLLAFILAIGIYDIWQNLIPVQYQAMGPEYVDECLPPATTTQRELGAHPARTGQAFW
jgi:hypothetical protein